MATLVLCGEIGSRRIIFWYRWWRTLYPNRWTCVVYFNRSISHCTIFNSVYDKLIGPFCHLSHLKSVGIMGTPLLPLLALHKIPPRATRCKTSKTQLWGCPPWVGNLYPTLRTHWPFLCWTTTIISHTPTIIQVCYCLRLALYIAI